MSSLWFAIILSGAGGVIGAAARQWIIMYLCAVASLVLALTAVYVSDKITSDNAIHVSSICVINTDCDAVTFPKTGMASAIFSNDSDYPQEIFRIRIHVVGDKNGKPVDVTSNPMGSYRDDNAVPNQSFILGPHQQIKWSFPYEFSVVDDFDGVVIQHVSLSYTEYNDCKPIIGCNRNPTLLK